MHAQKVWPINFWEGYGSQFKSVIDNKKKITCMYVSPSVHVSNKLARTK